VLRLPRFQYVRPSSLREAVSALADCGPQAMPVAGGTDVYPKMKRRQFLPRYLVSLQGVPELKGIRGDERAGLVIGAGCTLTEVASHPVVRRFYPGLAKAIESISTPVLRNMGTIGGNLCLDTRCNYYDQTLPWRAALGWCMKAPDPGGWPMAPEAAPAENQVPCRVAPGSPRCWAVASSDGAPALMALGAQARLVGPRGERVVPVGELYRDDGMFFLEKSQAELVAEVLLPPADGTRSTYWKLRRRGAFDFPVLGVAVALSLDTDGRVAWARLAVTGVASRPLLMDEAARLLVGQKPSPELVEAVAQAVYLPVRPLDNTDFAHYYRKRMAGVYVRRALQELLGPAAAA
jgi:4-hydroxybenzoyl-CoA reductase subunit beta